MLSQPKRATIVLNLSVLTGIIWLYYFENIPSVDVPKERELLAASILIQTRPAEPLERSLENSIKMAEVALPAPPLQTAKPAQREKQQSSIKQDNSVLMPLKSPRLQIESQTKQSLKPITSQVLATQPLRATKTALTSQMPAPQTPKKLKSLGAPTPRTPDKSLPFQPLKKLTALRPVKVPTLQRELITPEMKLNNKVVSRRQTLSQRSNEAHARQKYDAPSTLNEINSQKVSPFQGQLVLNKVAKEGGLDMEIFWPVTAHHSAYLYDVLTRCLGMRSAVIDETGNLFLMSGKSSKSHDTFSPLLRQLERPANQAEADMIAKIVKRNKININYKPVRIFTKLVDARLINAITHLTGKSIDSRSTLRANYEIDRGRVYVKNIINDGMPSSGRILLAEGGC